MSILTMNDDEQIRYEKMKAEIELLKETVREYFNRINNLRDALNMIADECSNPSSEYDESVRAYILDILNKDTNGDVYEYEGKNISNVR